MVMEERSLRTRQVAGSKRRIARRNQRTPESRDVFVAGAITAPTKATGPPNASTRTKKPTDLASMVRLANSEIHVPMSILPISRSLVGPAPPRPARSASFVSAAR
jgi:hypothetical protein